MYAVLCVTKDITVNAFGIGQKLPLSYAKGMVGAMPIFETLEAAKEYANGEHKTAVVEI